MRDFFREIWESLRRNMFRTSMTGFAIAWGMLILVILLGVSNGIENGLMASYGSRLNNAVDIWTTHTSLPYKGFAAYRWLEFTDREARIVREMPEVELFSCVHTNYNGSTVVYGSQTTGMMTKGVEADYQRIFRKDILRGRFINENDLHNNLKICVLDERAVEVLGATAEEIVGQYIILDGVYFRVVGVCAKGERWEGATVHIPFTTDQYIFNTGRTFDKMSITMTPGTQDMQKRIKEALAPAMQFDKNDPQAVGVWSMEEQVEEQMNVMAAIRLFILLLGLCTLMSGAVGISNIMLVTVRERTKELGIRKALGEPPVMVLGSIVGEAIVITTVFGVVGMLLGVGALKLLGPMAEQYGGEVMSMMIMNPSADTGGVLLSLLILIVIGVVAGAFPARRAMRIKPIEAMNADK